MGDPTASQRCPRCRRRVCPLQPNLRPNPALREQPWNLASCSFTPEKSLCHLDDYHSKQYHYRSTHHHSFHGNCISDISLPFDINVLTTSSSAALGFGLGFFVSDGGGREVSTQHSLSPLLRKRLVNLLLDGLHLRFLLLGDSKL